VIEPGQVSDLDLPPDRKPTNSRQNPVVSVGDNGEHSHERRDHNPRRLTHSELVYPEDDRGTNQGNGKSCLREPLAHFRELLYAAIEPTNVSM
jgi:hypothetical protein